MRLSIKKYQGGGEFALETTNDGTKVVAELLGARQAGCAIVAFAEIIGDDSVEGAEAMTEVLAYLKSVVAQRARDLGPTPTSA
jgi:hypothetical protein